MNPANPNVAASVRARLLNVAKAQGVDFNQVLVRFALERILYRLGQSQHADRFLLKGALLFTLWYDMPHRATRDADLLGFGPSDLASVAENERQNFRTFNLLYASTCSMLNDTVTAAIYYHKVYLQDSTLLRRKKLLQLVKADSSK